ncbi:hypothetical protein Pint_32905 [Pistacia integerrima]|uniref:Uncharacterized protein n=1 Tax=Pistacia integerrima TaxID=434235 RepID=A0ACC0X7J0_9ROSI|nr:hypothetical protein Pint_32905 [Pistacia integerrima]
MQFNEMEAELNVSKVEAIEREAMAERERELKDLKGA